MILNLVFFLSGVFLLIKGADWLVSGGSSISAKLKISPIVIGLTVVAFGTSAPELLVSTFSAFKGSTQLAVANVVGSNILNILLVLGLAALITPLKVRSNTVWKEIPMSFLAAVVLTILGLQVLLDSFSFQLLGLTSAVSIGSLTFSNGLILLFFFVIFMYYSFGIAKDERAQEEVKTKPLAESIFVLLIGVFALALGSNFTVNGAIEIAKIFNFSENLIGLTIVALGTSLPELVTSVTAAFKKEVDISIGNVVGSNIFNIFLVLGIVSLIRPVPLTGQNVADILVLLAATTFLFLSLFVLKKFHVSKIEGICMLSAYGFYLIFLLIRG